MASIGQDLKRERELTGITLQEIADATKINLRFLQALEEDHLDLLPGHFITRGIIRTYAGYIGLNQEDVLRRVLGQPPVEAGAGPSKNHEPPADRTVPESTRRTFRGIFIAAFALAVLIPLTIVLQKHEPEPVPPPEKPPEAMIPVEQRPHIKLPEPEPVWQGLNISITYQADTWIQIFADGVRVENRLMRAGATTEAHADREFVINLGNAGGPSFTLNGLTGKPFGDAGRVAQDIRITLDNYLEFVESENSTLKKELRAP